MQVAHFPMNTDTFVPYEPARYDHKVDDGEEYEEVSVDNMRTDDDDTVTVEEGDDDEALNDEGGDDNVYDYLHETGDNEAAPMNTDTLTSYEPDNWDDGLDHVEEYEELPVFEVRLEEDIPLNVATADFFNSNSVVILTDLTFDAFLQDNPAAFVDFYAPWCVWSQRLAPTWSRLASEVSDLPVAIGMVDCVECPNICKRQKVMAYPTMRWFQHGKAVAPNYNLDRTVEALSKFVKHQLSKDILDKEDIIPQQATSQYAAGEEGVSMEESSQDDKDEALVGAFAAGNDKSLRLTRETFDATVNGEFPVFVNFNVPWCIYSQELAPTWMALASEIADMPVLVRNVDCEEEPDVCKDQKLSAFPTLRWFRYGETMDYKPTMDRTVSSFADFVREQMNGAGLDEESLQEIREVTSEYYSGDSYIPSYHQTKSEDYSGDSAFDESVEDEVDDKEEAPHEFEASPEDYSDDVLADFRQTISDDSSGDSASDESMDNEHVFQGKYSITLSDENFHDFLEGNRAVFVFYYTSWCRYSAKMAPAWEAFALKMKEEPIEIAQVDCDACPKICQEERIIEYPTLRLYQQGEAVVPDYKMGRTAQAFIGYVKHQVSGIGVTKVVEEDELDGPVVLDEARVEASRDKPLTKSSFASSSHTEEEGGANDTQSTILPRWMTALW